MASKKSTVMTVRVPNEVAALIRAYAKDFDLTTSEVINQFIMNWLVEWRRKAGV